jgi:hypothetical protein
MRSGGYGHAVRDEVETPALMERGGMAICARVLTARLWTAGAAAYATPRPVLLGE